jgi:hypothetical protein
MSGKIRRHREMLYRHLDRLLLKIYCRYVNVLLYLRSEVLDTSRGRSQIFNALIQHNDLHMMT